MEKIVVKTHSKVEMVDVTSEVARVVQKSRLKDGLCVVFIPHTTAGITINENADPSVCRDVIKELNKVIPFDDNYAHSEGNAASHIKSSIMGSSVSIIVEGGQLRLGTWQGIYLCEFDGPRRREVWVKI